MGPGQGFIVIAGVTQRIDRKPDWTLSQAVSLSRSLLLFLMLIGAGTGCVSRKAGPVSRPFPEYSEPDTAIASAVAEAARSNRGVLLVFGANWCSDSRAMMSRLTTDPRLVPWVAEHWVLTPIDVGERGGPKWDAEVVRRYGRPFAERGIPALVVLDEQGRQITTRESNPLKDTDHRRPSRIRKFLESTLGR
jgi:hypothetical protein